MINLPIVVTEQAEARTMIYYSAMHEDMVERVLVAILHDGKQPLILDIQERIIDSSYVYIGEL